MKKFLKVKSIHILLTLVVIFGLVLIHITQAVTAADTPAPGSESDPIVTRGYVDAEIAKIKVQLDAISGGTGGGTLAGQLDEINQKLETLSAKVATGDTSLAGLQKDLTTVSNKVAEVSNNLDRLSEKVDKVSSFQKVFVEKGKTVILAGGSELVLRSGAATAIASNDGGLTDVTGTDLITGNAVPKNHLILVPVDDGRGIKTVTDVWLIIKGSYSVQ